MCKNKKREKRSSQSQSGGFKRFIKDVYQVLRLLKFEDDLMDMSNRSKRMMYDYNIRIRKPVAGNTLITPKELNLISEKTKRYYHHRTFSFYDTSLSCYQLQLFYCYLAVKANEMEKWCGFKNHPRAVLANDASIEVLDVFIKTFLVDYFKIVTQLSNPDQKYYGVYIDNAPIVKEHARMDLTCEIYGIPSQTRMITLKGHKRPAFRLAKVTANEPASWTSLNVSLFGKIYKGNKQEVDVFIQSHALRRLKERLDLMDQESINYSLWENTHDITQFITYQDYLLLPFKVFDVKIGYLAANIIDDKLLFRTFLFITHLQTPEGDRLKELTGLDKQEMKYWRIDRLSTFVKMDEEKYPELIQLFHQAGMGDLLKIKDKEFNIDNLQDANLNGLTEYIVRCQQESMSRVEESGWLLIGLEQNNELPDNDSIEKLKSSAI